MDAAPVVVSSSAGLRVLFGGHDGPDGELLVAGRMNTATADSAGATWTLPMQRRWGSNTTAYGSYGTAATTLADGTPVAAYPLNSDHVRGTSGTDSSADEPLHVSELLPCYSAVDGAQRVRRLRRRGTTTGRRRPRNGTFVKQILPERGPGDEGAGVEQGHELAAHRARRAGGPGRRRRVRGVLRRLPDLYRRCGSGRSGTTKTTDVAGTASSRPRIALSPGPVGPAVGGLGGQHRRRSTRCGPTRTGLRMGAVQNAGIPRAARRTPWPSTAPIGRGDIVLNDGNGMWHTQVVAGLTLRPRRPAGGTTREQKVIFTVTDAHDPMKGAKVAVGSSHCTTNSHGTCSITFAPSYAPGQAHRPRDQVRLRPRDGRAEGALTRRRGRHIARHRASHT